MDGNHGHMVLGGGGLTFDAGINLQDEAWWLHTVFSCPLHAEASVSALHYAGMTFLVENGILIPGNPIRAGTSRARPNLLVRRLVEVSVCGATSQRTTSSSTLRHWTSECGARYTSAGPVHAGRGRPRSPLLRTVGEAVPPHIADWLDLVDEGGIGDEYLIRYNIALMEPRQALGTLMSLTRKLEELRGSDPRVYRLIMQLLAPYDNWQFTRCRNGLMNATRRHTERRLRHRGQRGVAFHPTARGMLTVIRHCSQHAGRRHEDLMVLIIEDDFRRFAGYFQRVMYNMSQLRFLNLEVSMG